MKIDILKTNTVGEVKAQFSAVFAYLKLEFFIGKPGVMAPDSCTLQEVQPSMREGSITIHETMKVREVEALFEKDFQLNVQVSRRSGNVWLETTITDSWSLQQQDDHGREITKSFSPAEGPENDYELLRDQD